MPNRQNRRIRTNKPQEILAIRRPKSGLKIMVAGGISRYGKSELVIVDEKQTVNGECYRNKILPSYLSSMKNKAQFPCQEQVIFMQDGAPAHTAKLTMENLKLHVPTVWADWPGSSSDLNPVEHIWARLQDSVLRAPHPRNRQDLITRVKEEWLSVTQEELRDLIESFSKRCLECLDKIGNSTHY